MSHRWQRSGPKEWYHEDSGRSLTVLTLGKEVFGLPAEYGILEIRTDQHVGYFPRTYRTREAANRALKRYIKKHPDG